MSRREWEESGPYPPVDQTTVNFPIRLPKPIPEWRKADFVAGFFERRGFWVETEESPDGYIVILTGFRNEPVAP